jgi:outer membrane protein TolC
LNSFNPEKVFNPASLIAQLLGGLTAPVFGQHQLRTGFKVAQSQQEIAFLRYQQTVNRAFQEVKTLVSEMDNNQKVLDLKKQETEALSRSVDIANEMYVAAYANYLEIIAVQKSKLAADLDRLRARRNQMQIMIQLYKALGGGWS